jgi:hypothetical protein
MPGIARTFQKDLSSRCCQICNNAAQLGVEPFGSGGQESAPVFGFSGFLADSLFASFFSGFSDACFSPARL